MQETVGQAELGVGPWKLPWSCRWNCASGLQAGAWGQVKEKQEFAGGWAGTVRILGSGKSEEKDLPAKVLHVAWNQCLLL
jgi:hypothetical protein